MGALGPVDHAALRTACPATWRPAYADPHPDEDQVVAELIEAFPGATPVEPERWAWRCTLGAAHPGPWHEDQDREGATVALWSDQVAAYGHGRETREDTRQELWLDEQGPF